jgi:hypothetical protein
MDTYTKRNIQTIDRNLDLLNPSHKGRMHEDNEREFIWETLKLLRDELEKLTNNTTNT